MSNQCPAESEYNNVRYRCQRNVHSDIFCDWVRVEPEAEVEVKAPENNIADDLEDLLNL